MLPDVQREIRFGNRRESKFDVKQLAEMKKGCERSAFSTLGYNVAYCYKRGARDEVALQQAIAWIPGSDRKFLTKDTARRPKGEPAENSPLHAKWRRKEGMADKMWMGV